MSVLRVLVLLLFSLLSSYCHARSSLRALANATLPETGLRPTASLVRRNATNSKMVSKPKQVLRPRSSSSERRHKLSPKEIVDDLRNLTTLFDHYNATEMEGDLEAYISNITDILYEFNYNNSQFLYELNYMIKHEDYSNLTSLISHYNETEVELELKSGVDTVKKLVLFPDKEGENSYRNRVIIWCFAIITAYLAILLLICILKIFGGFTKCVFYFVILPLRCLCPIEAEYKPLSTGGDEEYNANADIRDFEDEDTTIESDVQRIETVPLSEDEEFERMMTLNDGETSFDHLGRRIDDAIEAVASEFEMPNIGGSLEGNNVIGGSMGKEVSRIKEFRF